MRLLRSRPRNRGLSLAMTFVIPFVCLVLLSGFSGKRNAAESILRGIPVQSGGRMKPFESFAREALLSITGKTSLEKNNATTVLWDWIARPETWNSKSFLPVRNASLRQEFSLMVIGGKISPELVLLIFTKELDCKE